MDAYTNRSRHGWRDTTNARPALLDNEVGDEVRHLRRQLQQRQVTAASDDDETRVRYQPGQDVSVRHGNQRVVVAGEDESRLLEAAQPRQSRPALHGPELTSVPLG